MSPQDRYAMSRRHSCRHEARTLPYPAAVDVRRGAEADSRVRFASLGAMPRPHPLRSLLILSLAALAFALAQTMLIPALTELAKSLHTDASGVAWTVTA